MLSLSGSTFATFAASAALRSPDKKFNMIDIQNATLAGGVAMVINIIIFIFSNVNFF